MAMGSMGRASAQKQNSRRAHGLPAFAPGAMLLLLALFASNVVFAQSVRLDDAGNIGIEPASFANSGVASEYRFSSPGEPLGRFAYILDEVPGSPLTLQEAQTRLAAGDFQRSTVPVPNLGNRFPPRWLHLNIDNRATSSRYRIYVAEGWTDYIDAWLTGPDGNTLHWQAGDERSPSRDLRPGLGYAFDASLADGRSKLFVRVQSIDSVALAIRMVPLADAAKLEGPVQHWLGIVHGFLLALVVTYGLLWLALREPSLLRYVGYVGGYLYMHLAYSGIGALTAWPDSPPIGRFAILVGMTLFSSAGISFARKFLGIERWAPRLDRALAWLTRLAMLAMAACVVTNSQGPAVSLAFGYITSFTLLMVVLGAMAVVRRREQARTFLFAASISMAGAFITTMAVMGDLPFNDITFRLIEVGIMLEATIWAFALGLRLRQDREDRAHALQLAQHDALTGLLNRRGFLSRALPALGAAEGEEQTALVMIDIDHFKAINDCHGHDAGDRTLVAVADRLRALVQDRLIARWGSEEFVILMPGVEEAKALSFAETLRSALASMDIDLSDASRINMTASLGVASGSTASLDQLLHRADAALYAAKEAGRNRVVGSTGLE